MENKCEAISSLLSNLSLDSASFASPSFSDESASSFQSASSSLQLDPSFELVVESFSLASVRNRPLPGFRVAAESDSGCICGPNCFESGVVDSSGLTMASNESGSGHVSAGSLADALPSDLPKVQGVRLDRNAVQRIKNRQIIVLQVISEGRVSADLFYALDEDSDSYVVILLLYRFDLV